MILLQRHSKRIALYASSSANRGGTGVYTRRLINGFKKAGISNVVAVGETDSGFVKKFVSEHFTIPSEIRSSGFDLLHLPAFGGRAVKGIPYAVTVHDMAFMAEPGWFPPLRSLYYRFHFPRVARNAAVIIADSDFTVSEIRKHLGLPAERVYLSATENTSNDTLFRNTFNVSGSYILSTSTIEPRKNILALLKAWPSIRKEHPNLTLIFSGRWGWGKASTRELLENSQGVRWLGSISNDLLMSAFAGTRLLVYPSLYEGFGLPPLEAAASGVPFVVGPSETLKEIFSSVAAGISGASPASISETVLNALEKTFDSFKLKEFAGQFTDSLMAQNTLKVYGKALL